MFAETKSDANRMAIVILAKFMIKKGLIDKSELKSFIETEYEQLKPSSGFSESEFLRVINDILN